MLDFEKEKMVKVALLKNLPNVLKLHGEDNQQGGCAREQRDGPEPRKSLRCVPAPEKLASPSGTQSLLSPSLSSGCSDK